jgi:hypothetical protein
MAPDDARTLSAGLAPPVGARRGEQAVCLKLVYAPGIFFEPLCQLLIARSDLSSLGSPHFGRSRLGSRFPRRALANNRSVVSCIGRLSRCANLPQLAATARIISWASALSVFAARTKTSQVLRQTAVPSSDDGIDLGHQLARLSNGFLRCHSGFRRRTPQGLNSAHSCRRSAAARIASCACIKMELAHVSRPFPGPGVA